MNSNSEEAPLFELVGTISQAHKPHSVYIFNNSVCLCYADKEVALAARNYGLSKGVRTRIVESAALRDWMVLCEPDIEFNVPAFC